MEDGECLDRCSDHWDTTVCKSAAGEPALGEAEWEEEWKCSISEYAKADFCNVTAGEFPVLASAVDALDPSIVRDVLREWCAVHLGDGEVHIPPAAEGRHAGDRRSVVTPNMLHALPEECVLHHLLTEQCAKHIGGGEDSSYAQSEKDAARHTGSAHERPTLPRCSDVLGREQNWLEDLHAKMFAETEALESDMIVADVCMQIARSGFDGALRREGGRGAADTRLPVEAMSCMVCYNLLLKPWTFSCGHSLCEDCVRRLRKCPLPGPVCRDSPSFVTLSSSGTVARQTGGGRSPGGGSRQSDVTVCVNLSLAAAMQRVFVQAPVSHEIKNKANGLLLAGQPAEAELLYREALKVMPDAFIVRGNLAQALLNQGKCADALREASAACHLCPSWHKVQI
jgi:hypothetical protein